jgi:hypothetical protein
METVKHPHSALPRDVHQSLPMATLHLYWVILRQTSDTVNLLLWGLHPKFSAFTAFHTALLVWAYPVDFTGVIFLLLLVLVRPDRWASAQTIPKTRPTPGSRQHYNVALSFILEFDTKFLLSFYRALCQLPEIQCFRGNLKKKKKKNEPSVPAPFHGRLQKTSHSQEKVRGRTRSRSGKERCFPWGFLVLSL